MALKRYGNKVRLSFRFKIVTRRLSSFLESRNYNPWVKIAQIAPLYESVPPRCYGGTERVVSYLTEELVRKGHDVTLFASGDSMTSAHLVDCCSKAVRLDHNYAEDQKRILCMLDRVAEMAGRFDVLHFHIGHEHLPVARRLGVPYLATLHGRLDLPELIPVHQRFPEAPVISISNSQRGPLPWLNWQATIYHGLPPRLLSFKRGPGAYLAFLGRFSPEKRPDRAVRIAKSVGMKLKMAAKADAMDRGYVECVVKPLLRESHVEWLGEINEAQKSEFLGNARALLFPIDWPEPFGLAVIEAMACGTPVIAFRNGSTPELIEEGITGFLVDSEEDAVEAVRRAESLDRLRIRQVFEHRFTVSRMADDYLAIYQKLAATTAQRWMIST